MSEVRILYVGADQALGELVGQVDNKVGGAWFGKAVPDGNAATAELTGTTYDLVLADSDLQNPDVITLLRNLRETSPSVLRYVVSDVSDKSQMLRLFDEAHQVVAKPWQEASLLKQLRNALGLKDILANEEVKSRIASVQSLPCLPETYTKLTSELRGDDVSIRRVADLISSDAAIAAKLLQVVNSAFFGLSRRVEDVAHAVNMVGLETVQSLVLSAGVFDQFKGIDIPQSSVEELYSSSVAVGARARLLAHSFNLHPRAAEESLLGGMMHDIGKLLMAKCFQNEFLAVAELVDEKGISIYEAEEELLGVNDAAIGAYLLSLWGLANPIVEAVALHHRPSKCPCPEIGPLTIVHLAWCFDEDERNKVRNDEDSVADTTYLSKVGLDGQLPILRGFCAGAVA